ncbi:hypothetical protein M0R01_00790 [bacterium]|nr:hypothetical protein [bacterium]
MSYYVQDSESLAKEIMVRQENREQIEKRINDWVISEWGIPNFTSIISDVLPLQSDVPYGALCRQVATARIEEVSFSMVCKLLGLKSLDLTYNEDAFSTSNRDKVHLLKLPVIIGHSKSGQPIVKYQKIVDFPQTGKLLNRISIDGNGTNLPKYHRSLRIQTFGNDIPSEYDIGPVFKRYLSEATNMPDYVYEDVDGIRIKKSSADDYDLSKSNPPADWYYPLYLLAFATGRMVLFETYENPEGLVCDIKEHFCHAMDMIRDAIGIYPLVAEIAPLKLPMMYINQALIERNDWQQELVLPSKKQGKIVDLFQDLADQAISLRKNN